MRSRVSFLPALVVVLTAPSTAFAQGTAVPPLVGELVRVTSVEGRQLIGTAGALSGESIEVTAAPPGRRTISFPIAEIQTLERRIGDDDDTGRGAKWGAGIGFATGMIVGAALSDGPCSDCNEVRLLAATGGVGALGGLLIGSLIGALSSSTVWEVVSLETLSRSIDLDIDAERRLGLSGRVTIPPGPRN